MDNDSPMGTDDRSLVPRKLLLGAGLGVALGLIVVVGFFAGLFFLSRGGDFPGAPAAGSAQLPAGVPGRQPSDPRFAFLLMGYGGAGHDGAYLTDSMMVAIVDPSHRTLTLLSIPRDAWVPLVFSDQTTVYNKLNTAYSFASDASLYSDRLPRYKGKQGPGSFASDTTARLLGIPVPYYLALDFAGFREAVNALGGIDVTVPDAFSAWYPTNDDPSIDPSWTEVKFDKGRQHMDGERAIRYSRAREAIDNPNEGTDFARSQRQRLIIEAFKDRLFQPAGLVHIPELLGVAARHVDTNYSVPSALQIAQLAVGWGDVRAFQAALTNENYLTDSTGPEGTYTLVPDSPDRSWAQVQAFARRLWQDPELGAAVANAEVVVENDSGVAGLAGRVGTRLSKLGYRVGTPVTGTASSHSEIVDQSDGQAKALARGLEADLQVKLGEPKAGQKQGPGRVILRIGSDSGGVAD